MSTETYERKTATITHNGRKYHLHLSAVLVPDSDDLDYAHYVSLPGTIVIPKSDHKAPQVVYSHSMKIQDLAEIMPRFQKMLDSMDSVHSAKESRVESNA